MSRSPHPEKVFGEKKVLISSALTFGHAQVGGGAENFEYPLVRTSKPSVFTIGAKQADDPKKQANAPQAEAASCIGFYLGDAPEAQVRACLLNDPETFIIWDVPVGGGQTLRITDATPLPAGFLQAGCPTESQKQG